MISDASRRDLETLPADIRDAWQGQLVEDRLTVIVAGEACGLVADADALCLIAAGRHAPVVSRIPFADVAYVDATLQRGSVLVQIACRNGRSQAMRVPGKASEEALQAATILNLLAVQAGRSRASGRGIGAERPNWRDRVKRVAGG